MSKPAAGTRSGTRRADATWQTSPRSSGCTPTRGCCPCRDSAPWQPSIRCGGAGDARTRSLTSWRELAWGGGARATKPGRCSCGSSANRTCTSLRARGTPRRYVPSSHAVARYLRLNLARACQWLRECEAEPEESHPISSSTIAAWLGKVMAAPALALFCRIHSQQPWARKNLFFASSYALRACNLPKRVCSMQQFHSHSHARVQVVSPSPPLPSSLPSPSSQSPVPRAPGGDMVFAAGIVGR